MLLLVKMGFENLYLATNDAPKSEQWLIEKLGGQLYQDRAVTAEQSHNYTMVYLQSEQTVKMVCIPLTGSQVLSALLQAADFPAIETIKTLPRTIFMSMGQGAHDVKAVVEKIASELHGEALEIGTVYKLNKSEGAVLSFVSDTKAKKFEIAYNESLYLAGNYIHLLNYLKIHVPRYLSKMYAADSWHMIDVRMFDEKEKYNVHYLRLLKAIEGLDLGYVVEEAWEREVERFSHPVGCYRIRLLTFMEPYELKTWLMALEYDQKGKRIVDLDAFYHKKKISWRDIMNDKAYSKKIKGDDGIFAKSIFFAEPSNKVAMLEYCKKQLSEKMTPELADELAKQEAKIDA